jgi:hypothetical protein
MEAYAQKPVIWGFRALGEQPASKCMSNPSTPSAHVISSTSTHLLDAIRATRESVGEGLNDDEFTRLLQQTTLPTEAGFAFLSFCSGIVTLSVPQQDPAAWYPEKGWIAPEKEKVARAIAEKHGLSLGEPPDEASSFRFPRPDAANTHHHLELRNRWDAIIVAHPNYLKVRLFGASPDSRYTWNTRTPVILGPDLLQTLAALYQP